MIRSVIWPDPRIGDYQSPFQRGEKERPLRLTLHTPSMTVISDEEEEAYDVIEELGALSEVELLYTDRGNFPYLHQAQVPGDDGYFNLEIYHEDEPVSIHLGIHPSRITNDIVYSLIGVSNVNDPAYLKAKDAIISVEAHHSLGRDIFVTGSSILLANREKFNYSNIQSPSEAAKLVGLFLRSRDIWVYKQYKNAQRLTVRGRFYWILTRSKLPAMWSYFSACVRAKKYLGDEIYYTGQAILMRCVRAMQARDAIGEQFYLPQSRSTNEITMYHFDYLTLLIAGAFDAQAKIANIIYGLVDQDISIGFRKKRFLKLLKENHGILYELVTSERCNHLMDLLHTLRNTIHNAGLNISSQKLPGEKLQSMIEVPAPMHQTILQASQGLGGLEIWGVVRDEYSYVDGNTGQTISGVRVSLEPYSYATRLINEWLSLIDDIAVATEVERLFMDTDPPNLRDQPPDDWLQEMQRYSLLGG